MGNQLKKCSGKMDQYNKDMDALKSNMEKAQKGVDAVNNLEDAYEKDGITGGIGQLDKELNGSEKDK